MMTLVLAALLSLQDAPADLRDWISKRVEALGNDDYDVRERATSELKRLKEALDAALEQAAKSDDPEVRARAKLVKPIEPKPIVISVKAHSEQKGGAFTVEFNCVHESMKAIGFKISGGEFARIELVNGAGKAAPATSRPDEHGWYEFEIPEGFGRPVEMRIFPRP